MREFAVKGCLIGSDVIHKVQRYKRNVASGLVPDVLDLLRKFSYFTVALIRPSRGGSS